MFWKREKKVMEKDERGEKERKQVETFRFSGWWGSRLQSRSCHSSWSRQTGRSLCRVCCSADVCRHHP